MRHAFITLLLAAGVSAPLNAQSDDLRIRLGSDTTIAGIRCMPTGRASAVIYPNGRLDECPIAVDTVMAGHQFPRGTWIRLSEEGVLKAVWLPEPLTVQGLPCRGTGYKGWAVTFHPNGRLSLCFLDDPAVIDGVPCAAATFLREMTGNSGVVLRDDGRLQSCRLSRDYEYNGVTYRKGKRITVSPQSP